MRKAFGMFATCAALLCAFDAAQWVAERYELASVAGNLLGAAIATALQLATGKIIGGTQS